MQAVPYKLNQTLIRESSNICQELKELHFNQLMMFLLFNDGTNTLFSTKSDIVNDYYEGLLDLDDLIYQKKLLDGAGGPHSYEITSNINVQLKEKYKVYAEFSFSRSHAEGRFVFVILKDCRINQLSINHYEQVRKQLQILAIRFMDAVIQTVIRFDPSFEHSFIMTNKGLRDAVIKQEFKQDIILSYIERKCIWLSFLGHSAKQVAEILNMKPGTIEKYLTRIRRQFNMPLPRIYIECILRGIIGKFTQT